MLTIPNKLETILNRLDVIENGVDSCHRTIDTIESENDTLFVSTAKGQKLKLIRYLMRKRPAINQIFANLGLPQPSEQELVDMIVAIEPFEIKTFETEFVSSDYEESFRIMRLSAVEYLRTVGHDSEVIYNRLWRWFPLTSCMVDAPKGSLDHYPRKSATILGLYDAINSGNTTCHIRGVKYRVKVKSLSGYVREIPKIELRSCGNKISKLDMFRCLIWELQPVDCAKPTLRMLDKTYHTNSNVFKLIKRELIANNGITHVREHNHLTDASEGDSVRFESTIVGVPEIADFEFLVGDYRIDRYFPYVDSFKYVQDGGNSGVWLSLMPNDDTSHVAESTHGGIMDWTGVGCRCESCDTNCHPDDSMYSERLDQTLCDSCYCELIIHCDHCSTELAMGSDTIYRLPDRSYSCDCCTEEV